MGDQIWVIVAP